MTGRCPALLSAVWLALAGPSASAAELPRALVPGSYAALLAAHPGEPKIIAFWSLGCDYCLEELPELAALAARFPAVRLILVSTDTPDDGAVIRATLATNRLGGVDSWVFADEPPEHLRHEIDPRWRGELPQTVLQARDGARRVLTGRPGPGLLEQWLIDQHAGDRKH